MDRELKYEEVVYDFNFNNISLKKYSKGIPEYEDIYKKIQLAVEIEKEGYNLYIIDKFSKERLQNIIKYTKKLFKKRNKPKDICYVVMEDEKAPEVMYVTAGMGAKLKESLEDMQKKYVEVVYEFYNSSSSKEKEAIIDSMEKEKNKLVNTLIKLSEQEGFALKVSKTGFAFIPLEASGKIMSEEEYESISEEAMMGILDKVEVLKAEAEIVLDKIKHIELSQIETLKLLMKKHLVCEMKEFKNMLKNTFLQEIQIINYFEFLYKEIEEEILQVYTIDYSEDEESINQVIFKYMVNVIVDNKDQKDIPIIFEEDPSLSNLLGSIDFENRNGVYTTDVSLINSGSLLKANGGCLIIRLSSLMRNPEAYYELKKSLLSRKVDFDYNRGYLEILSLKGLKPKPIEFNEKIIIIGDYYSYNLLYSYDEDFKDIFKLKAEYKGILKIDDEVKVAFLKKILQICKNNKLKPMTNEANKQLAKYMVRKSGERDKICIDEGEMSTILTLASNRVKNEKRNDIEGEDIVKVAYEEELIEKEMHEEYIDKLFIKVSGVEKGQVNGLSVIGGGHFSIGRPIRITCCCYKGEGNIIDVQKESHLSGNIHNKSINILKGYMNTVLGGYEKLPVDFHLSFEQVYGKIDGDSASVAEVIAMLSALSKLGINQNIAVTGSINQFGQVQPIGGLNEKIEGFFKVCQLIDNIEDKGVLIPEANVSSLILSEAVEEEIKKGKFHIYAMKTIEDAVNVLIEGNITYDQVLEIANKEIGKYKVKRRIKNQ